MKTTVEKIRAQYMPQEKSKVETLKALNAKVHRPVKAFAYTFGSVGALVLGTGMCFAMKIIGDVMPLGIAVGVVGMGMMVATYFLYQKILNKRKKKYAEQIYQLADEISAAD